MHGLLATLFFFGLSQAATVFFSPPQSLPSVLSPQQAHLVVSAHVGLEQFDFVTQSGRLNHLFRERSFVGQGDQNALLLLVDEEYAHDVIPSALRPSFTLSESAPDSWPSFIKTCTQRALHIYTHVAGDPSLPTEGVPRTLDIFSAPTPADEAFLAEMTMFTNYLDSTPASDRFAALELTGVSKLAASYGTSSEQYRLATEAVHAAIGAALADKSVHLAVITYAPNSKKRNPDLFPGIVLSSQHANARAPCFSSWLACTEATDECSGHGQCTNATRAGRACFVCACKTTISEAGKVENWAGETCARKDVSGPFVLITGTVIALILLIGGSVSLLYAVSTHELPSILTGGVAGGLRKE